MIRGHGPITHSAYWRTPVFSLDARLAQDAHVIGDFPLCRLLLSNDANYPWFILVPRRPDITEVFHLNDADRQVLWSETDTLAKLLHQGYGADKINIATLGNVVSQLHMHVIVRYRTDAAWPAPVWGKLPAVPYTEEQLAAVRDTLASVLGTDFVFSEGRA
jgi:diadenosine tetraphosphate (Ap4A) HIT family hydrolase